MQRCESSVADAVGKSFAQNNWCRGSPRTCRERRDCWLGGGCAECTQQHTESRLCRRADSHWFSVWTLGLPSNSYFCCLFKPFQISTGQNSCSGSRYNCWTMRVLWTTQQPQPTNHSLLLHMSKCKSLANPKAHAHPESCTVPWQLLDSLVFPCLHTQNASLSSQWCFSAGIRGTNVLEHSFSGGTESYKQSTAGAALLGSGKMTKCVAHWLQPKGSLPITASSWGQSLMFWDIRILYWG